MIPIKLSKDHKQALVSRIQTYFIEEKDEEIGNLAAENLLDFVLHLVGPHVYNQALADARKLVNDRMQTIEDELYAMEQSEFTRR